MIKYSLLFLLALPFLSISQKNIESVSSIDLITEGVDLHNEKEYLKAIDLYDKVSVNDTNYSVAQYEKALSYFAMEDYAEVINVIDDLLELNLPYENKHYVYSLLGSAYDENGQLEAAVKAFNLGLEKYPKSYLLWYNRALVFTKLNQHKQAIEDYKYAIQCYAGHTSSHYQLALYALHEGHYTEAMLGFTTYLLLDPTSNRSNDVLQIMENISNGEYEEKPKGFDWDEEEDYEQLNVFFKNKVALEKNYKVNLTIDVSFGKQLHFLLSNLKYDKGNKGFWNQTYVPILREIFEEDKIDDLTLFCLQSSGSAKIQSKLKSKKSKLDAFISLAQEKWNNHVNYKYVDFEGKYQQVFIGYSHSSISNMGLVENDNPIGTWYYYYPNGALEMKGEFSKEGKRIGKWIVYNEINGNVSNNVSFVDGERNGESLNYYYSGELQKRMTNKDNELQDTIYYYFHSGDLSEKYVVVDGEKNGPIKGYHENGALDYSYSFTKGSPSGKYQAFYPNNQLSLEFNLVDGLYEGVHTSYYENGTKKSEVNYIKDLRDGIYREWYQNGILAEETTYKEGKTVNQFKEYYSNGQLSNLGQFDETGKENGISTDYDFDGVKYFEREFKKGDLISVKNYNKKGELIHEANKKGKKLDYKIYYPDGNLMREGMYENNSKTGVWKYYTRYGTLSAIENYKDGLIVDTAKYFYNNGQLKSLENYENGELNGLYLNYNIYGDLIQEGTFLDGEWDKDFYEYNSDGKLVSEFYYVNGTLNGILKSYGVNGKLVYWKKYEYGKEVLSNFLDTNELKIDSYNEFHGEIKLNDFNNKFIRYKATYKNGQSDGMSYWYNPDKSINTAGSFINGKKHGAWKHYYLNGKIYKELNYVNGLLDGVYNRYASNGKLVYTANYKNDILEGIVLEYLDNGQLLVERNYLNDELHGRIVYYNNEGEIYMVRYYDNGIFVSYSYIGNDGNEVKPINLTKGDNFIVTYYKNGKKASEHHRNNGLIEGHFLVYQLDGKVESDEMYQYGDLNGLSVFYNKNGSIIEKKNYKKDEAHGENLIYFDNGKIKVKTNYLYDSKHGYEYEFNQEGKIINTFLYYDDELIEIKK